MQKIPERFRPILMAERETGMGYWVVNVTLIDGRVFRQVVIDSGYVTKVKGFNDVPFDGSEIAEIKVTHEKWQFNGGGSR
jgi:hypothetical protein